MKSLTKQGNLFYGVLCGMFLVFLLLLMAHCDETKTDQIPIEYKHAQDIMAKKNIDGKAKKKTVMASYYIRIPNTAFIMPVDASIPSMPAKHEKESKEDKDGGFFLAPTLSDKGPEKPDLLAGVELNLKPYHFSEDIGPVDFVNMQSKKGDKK